MDRLYFGRYFNRRYFVDAVMTFGGVIRGFNNIVRNGVPY